MAAAAVEAAEAGCDSGVVAPARTRRVSPRALQTRTTGGDGRVCLAGRALLHTPQTERDFAESVRSST